MEAVEGVSALQAGNYTKFGVDVGKIVSDVFIKSPLSSDWTYNNSEVFQMQLAQKGVPNFDYLNWSQGQKLQSGNIVIADDEYSELEDVVKAVRSGV